jgi:hypothetical protein
MPFLAKTFSIYMPAHTISPFTIAGVPGVFDTTSSSSSYQGPSHQQQQPSLNLFLEFLHVSKAEVSAKDASTTSLYPGYCSPGLPGKYVDTSSSPTSTPHKATTTTADVGCSTPPSAVRNTISNWSLYPPCCADEARRIRAAFTPAGPGRFVFYMCSCDACL